jgi:hypothetical protein
MLRWLLSSRRGLWNNGRASMRADPDRLDAHPLLAPRLQKMPNRLDPDLHPLLAPRLLWLNRGRGGLAHLLFAPRLQWMLNTLDLNLHPLLAPRVQKMLTRLDPDLHPLLAPRLQKMLNTLDPNLHPLPPRVQKMLTTGRRLVRRGRGCARERLDRGQPGGHAEQGRRSKQRLRAGYGGRGRHRVRA